MFGVMMLSAAPSLALAGDGSSVKVSGKIWTSYGVDLTDPDDLANGFEVDRAYLTAKKKIGDDISTRVTLDVGRMKDQTTSFVDSAGTEVEVEIPQDPRLQAWLKYAYVGWKATDDIELRLGAAGTPYVGFAEKVWGHRYMSKVFVDSVGIQGSSDIGLHGLGEHADGKVGWAAAVMNGGGVKKVEDDLAKRAQLRFTFDPMAGGDNRLPLTLYGGTEVGGTDDPMSFVLGSVGFKSEVITLLVDYATVMQSGNTGQGAGLALVPSIPDLVEIPVRVDWFDPSTDLEGDSATRIMAGLSRKVAKKVRLAGMYERTTPEGAADQAEHGVVARLEAGF